MIRAIAFDFDGLMFNTEELYAEVAEELLRRRGHQLAAELLTQMTGLPGRVGIPLMIRWYGLSDTAEDIERETSAIFREILPGRLAPRPGLLSILEQIDQRRLPKAIATSSRLPYVARVLELARLPTQFEFILTADDVRDGKPHPEIYELAARRFQIPISEMLVLEDSAHGCQAAVSAGAFAVAIPGPHNPGTTYPGVQFVAEALDDLRIQKLLR